jgi:hypothetical protein
LELLPAEDSAWDSGTIRFLGSIFTRLLTQNRDVFIGVLFTTLRTINLAIPNSFAATSTPLSIVAACTPSSITYHYFWFEGLYCEHLPTPNSFDYFKQASRACLLQLVTVHPVPPALDPPRGIICYSSILLDSSLNLS